MAKIVRLTESDLNRLVRRVIKEQNTDNKSNFKIITDNNWSELPSALESSTLSGVFGGAIYILRRKKDEVPGLEKVITADMYNKSCCMFKSTDNVVYLFMYDGMHAAGNVQRATIEKGTSEEYSKYYSKSKEMVKELPEGTTEYILIKTEQDTNLSSLIILKNGKVCSTPALPKPGYPPFKNCQ
jgi:hypothetical protein